jgi:FAD/FMN-containing dehydrogenase
MPSIDHAISEMAGGFAGRLLRPGEPGFDAARRVHNGMVDKRPALIAQCRGVADIVDAVNLARDLGLELAVRGGGHNVAGHATVEGGLMIDLSLMKGIHIDPIRRTVRAQGGATWADVNRETQLHGLAVTGGVVSTTGIAGLTLGGGIGWLMGKYGLALDNLLSVELVAADGRAMRASAEENPDLFWAIRGGGGNFGVVTSFEYRLFQVGPVVTGGLIAYPFDSAREMLRFYRDFTGSVTDECEVAATLVHAPDGSGTKLAAMVACHCGSAEDGATAFRPIKQFGFPAMDALGSIPYCQLNSMLDDGYPKGALNYWKSSFLTALSDDAIDTMIEYFAVCPTPMGQLLLEHFHGAATRVGPSDTAFPHRMAGYNFLVASQTMDPAISDRCTAWVRQTYAAMEPFMASGRYVNYLDDDETGEAVPAAYGPNYRRLREIKTTYDPGNLFHMNQNIRPLGVSK